jgi:hypothetical protein
MNANQKEAATVMLEALGSIASQAKKSKARDIAFEALMKAADLLRPLPKTSDLVRE